jgi:hypothetical protein
MGHYYDDKGECFDIRVDQARKLGLNPSVTTILSILAKEGLVKWRIQQAVLSALTMPRRPDESEDDYIKRIYIDADETGKNAAGLGTLFHEMAEHYFKTGESPIIPEGRQDLKTMFYKFREGMKALCLEPVFVEKSFVNTQFGIACRADLIAKRAVDGGNTVMTLIDLKTQGVKATKKAQFYDEHLYQLAGNYLCCRNEIAVDSFMNIVISTDPDTLGDIHYKTWPNEDVARAMEMFLHLREVYRIMKRI